MRRIALIAASCSIALSGCAAYEAAKTGQPIDPAKVQQDIANANYLLQAAGCAVAQQSALAAPVVTISSDAQGQQVLQAVDAAGVIACRMVVPPTALPAPVPVNAPPVAAPVK